MDSWKKCQRLMQKDTGYNMLTQLECIPCFIRQSLDALKQITDDENIIKNALRRVLKETSEFDYNLSPPEMGQIIHDIIRRESSNDDPYSDIKKRSNECALEFYSDIKNKVLLSEDPYMSAIRYSLAGNILDFALASAWDMEKIDDSFSKAMTHTIDIDVAEELRSEIKTANNILILGDNVGETVFDKILIEQLDTKAEVYYAVKESPIINDATEKDAIEAGLDSVSRIISNGYNAPGTILDKCSTKFKKEFNKADVIIAKGQANFETLNHENNKIYFLTQIKCETIAERYGYCIGDWIVTNTNKLKLNDKRAKI